MTLITKSDPESSLMNARIGWGNLLTSTNGAGEESLTPTTYDRFTSTTTSVEIRYRMSSVAPISFIGIAAHTLGTHDGGVGVEVRYAATISGSQISIDYIIPPDNSALMFTFDEVEAEEVILKFTSTTVGVEIGVFSAGLSLEMQRPIFGGHTPINLNANTKYQSVKSESGNMLGRSITRQGLESSFSWQNLDDTWVRDYFKPFMIAARTNPFFIKTRPDFYTYESAYGQTTGDIRVSNQGGGTRLMTASFNMDAHSDI